MNTTGRGDTNRPSQEHSALWFWPFAAAIVTDNHVLFDLDTKQHAAERMAADWTLDSGEHTKFGSRSVNAN